MASTSSASRSPPRHSRSTYPGLLRSAGYWTGYVGKYDVGAARPADFDFLRTYHGRHWLEGAGGERVHVTEQNARDSIDFLRARPKDKPFLLSVGYFAPHAEDSAKEQYLPQDWSAAAYRGREGAAIAARRREVSAGAAAVSVRRRQ